jgi:hypothetical protein
MRERLISIALKLQQKRGTPWSVEEVQRLLGYTDALVLDRATGLVYDGRADHGGAHVFNGGLDFGTIIYTYYDGSILHDGTAFYNATLKPWSEYKIRLYIDKDSRAFAEADRLEAANLAAAWAPLRATLAGWEARHVLSTPCEDPLHTASQITAVGAQDTSGTRCDIDNFWVSTDSGQIVIRWRANAETMDIGSIVAVALIAGVRPIAVRKMPTVQLAPDVIYEGAWALTEAE